MSTTSQAEQILRYLLAGNSLTPLEALDKFGCFRLGARIWDLRKAGHPIDDELVRQNGKKFSRYFMNEKGPAVSPGLFRCIRRRKVTIASTDLKTNTTGGAVTPYPGVPG